MNRAAQSSLRNTLVAAKVAYTDDSDFSGVTGTSLDAIEPALTYVTTDSTGPNEVSWDVDDVVGGSGDAQEFSVAAYSESGDCYHLREAGTGAAAGTYYGPTPRLARLARAPVPTRLREPRPRAFLGDPSVDQAPRKGRPHKVAPSASPRSPGEESGRSALKHIFRCADTVATT